MTAKISNILATILFDADMFSDMTNIYSVEVKGIISSLFKPKPHDLSPPDVDVEAAAEAAEAASSDDPRGGRGDPRGRRRGHRRGGRRRGRGRRDPRKGPGGRDPRKGPGGRKDRRRGGRKGRRSPRRSVLSAHQPCFSPETEMMYSENRYKFLKYSEKVDRLPSEQSYVVEEFNYQILEILSRIRYCTVTHGRCEALLNSETPTTVRSQVSRFRDFLELVRNFCMAYTVLEGNVRVGSIQKVMKVTNDGVDFKPILNLQRLVSRLDLMHERFSSSMERSGILESYSDDGDWSEPEGCGYSSDEDSD